MVGQRKQICVETCCDFYVDDALACHVLQNHVNPILAALRQTIIPASAPLSGNNVLRISFPVAGRSYNGLRVETRSYPTRRSYATPGYYQAKEFSGER